MEGAPRGRPGPLTDVERFLSERPTYLDGPGLGMPATGHVAPEEITDADIVGALNAYRWSTAAAASHLGISERGLNDHWRQAVR